MRRIIHQRNSFNNFHKMIGGMEDEEWARRQRERDEWWEREREREWRKREHSRETDDKRRGHWEVTKPLTPDEENELRELKNWDLWEEVTDPSTGEQVWRLRDPIHQQRHDELEYKDSQHKGTTNYRETRLPPQEYYDARNIEREVGVSSESSTRDNQTPASTLQEYTSHAAFDT